MDQRSLNSKCLPALKTQAKVRLAGLPCLDFDDLVAIVDSDMITIDKAFCIAVYHKRALIKAHKEIIEHLLKDHGQMCMDTRELQRVVVILQRELSIYQQSDVKNYFHNLLDHGEALYPANTNQLANILSHALCLAHDKSFVEFIATRGLLNILDFYKNPGPDLPPVLNVSGDDFGNPTPSAVMAFIIAARASDIINVWQKKITLPKNLAHRFGSGGQVEWVYGCTAFSPLILPRIGMPDTLRNSIFYMHTEDENTDLLVAPNSGYSYGSQYDNWVLAKKTGELRRTAFYAQDCSAFLASLGMCVYLQYDIFSTNHAYCLRQIILDHNSLSEGVGIIGINNAIKADILRLFDALSTDVTPIALQAALAPFSRIRMCAEADLGRLKNKLNMSVMRKILGALLSLMIFSDTSKDQAINFWQENMTQDLIFFINGAPKLTGSPFDFLAQSHGHVGIVESIFCEPSISNDHALVSFMAYSRDIPYLSDFESEDYNLGAEGAAAYDVRMQDLGDQRAHWFMAMRRGF